MVRLDRRGDKRESKGGKGRGTGKCTVESTGKEDRRGDRRRCPPHPPNNMHIFSRIITDFCSIFQGHALEDNEYGDGEGQIWLDELNCSGSEHEYSRASMILHSGGITIASILRMPE